MAKYIYIYARSLVDFFSPPPSFIVYHAGLSPYLKFGCVSARYFAHRLNQIYSRSNGKHTKPPVSLMGQLLWREFFYTCSVGMENFDKVADLIDWIEKQ